MRQKTDAQRTRASVFSSPVLRFQSRVGALLSFDDEFSAIPNINARTKRG